MIAKHLIIGNIPVVRPGDSIQQVLNWMDDCSLSHLPLVEGDLLSGVMAEKDCLAAGIQNLTVAGSKLPLTDAYVESEEHLLEVLHTASSHRLTMVPVVTSGRRYLGAIPVHALLPQLTAMTSADHPGGVIVLEINQNDYNLTEIAQIVESNDARVLSLFLSPFPDSTRLEVILKVNRMEIGAILQTFTRYNYEISASWAKGDTYHEGLQQRFDALMNYLNI